jgi:LysR family glycine cleavage system transcriptional activator
MAKKVPPLNPLRVFEVVARTENLTTAARDLGVSQSAVSRQVAVLEKFLGVELFRRERHGVMLTRVGKSYAEQIMPAFDMIASATEELTKANVQGSLRIRTYTTFAAKWLIPRLGDFKQRHRNIDVKIVNAVPDVDFDRDAVDFAVQFGDGRWPRVKTDLVFADEIEPVCSPEYLKRESPLGDPQILLGKRLLVSSYRRSDWDDWLAVNNLQDRANNTERMSFSSSVLTWQAALDGLGIAIGQAAMLGAELKAGRLVRPFQKPLKRDKGHYLLRPEARRESPKVIAFRNWLLEMARKTGH